MTKNLSQKFIDWACSLSGCDGGNPEAKIWLSGIEWGLGGEGREDYYGKELPEEIEGGKYTPPSTYDLPLTYRYGRNVAKLYCAIKGRTIEEYKKIGEECDGSEIFKTNLYPIPFRSTDPELWSEYGLEEITGFKDKYSFKTWCFLNRFPVISKMVEKHSPKLIIGTGISYLEDFFACYASTVGIDGIINLGKIENPNKKPRQYYWAKLNNGTALVVIPFFSGQFGLNSDHLISEMGKKIREKFFS